MVLTRTTALADFHHNYLLLAERCTGEGPRQRLWKVRAKEVILGPAPSSGRSPSPTTTGPAPCWRKQARAIFAVSPLRRASAASSPPTTTRPTAPPSQVRRAGAGEITLVDSRPHPEGDLIEERRRAGVPILAGSVVSGVESTAGGQAIEAVRVAAFRRA